MARLRGEEPVPLPETTMLGALMRYLKTPNKDFQPMGANMGILPGLKDEIRDKKERYAGYASRALSDLKAYLEKNR
jgi:methylenetetrahydrofolate--tRNA-(uracil-5-)-methyltransferase